MHLKWNATSDDECDELEKGGCYLNNGYRSEVVPRRSVKAKPNVWRHSYLAHLALSQVKATSLTSVSTASMTSPISERTGSVEQLLLKTRKWFGRSAGGVNVRSQSLSALAPGSASVTPILDLKNPQLPAFDPGSTPKSAPLYGSVRRRIRSWSNASLPSDRPKRSISAPTGSESEDLKKAASRTRKQSFMLRVRSGIPFFDKGNQPPPAWVRSSSKGRLLARPMSAPQTGCVAVSFSGSPTSVAPERGEFRPRLSSVEHKIIRSVSSSVLTSVEPRLTQPSTPEISFRSSPPERGVFRPSIDQQGSVSGISVDPKLTTQEIDSGRSSPFIADEAPASLNGSTDEDIIKGILSSTERVVRRNRRLSNRRSFVPRLSREIILEADPEAFEIGEKKVLTYEDFIRDMQASLVNGSLDAITSTPLISQPEPTIPVASVARKLDFSEQLEVGSELNNGHLESSSKNVDLVHEEGEEAGRRKRSASEP